MKAYSTKWNMSKYIKGIGAISNIIFPLLALKKHEEEWLRTDFRILKSCFSQTFTSPFQYTKI